MCSSSESVDIQGSFNKLHDKCNIIFRSLEHNILCILEYNIHGVDFL